MGKREIKIETADGMTWSLIPNGNGVESKLSMSYDAATRAFTMQGVVRVYVVETLAESTLAQGVAAESPAAALPAAVVETPPTPPALPVVTRHNAGSIVTAEDIERLRAQSAPSA
jgi:hypothetical protein